MNTDLTAEQIASYRENGFVVIENFLTPDELEDWRRCVDEAVTQRADLAMYKAKADKQSKVQVFKAAS